MKVVLFQPQIPQNAGNIVRTCAITGSSLVFVKPLGFSLQDRWLKRAGLDYWEGVEIEVIDSIEEYLDSHPSFYFFSSKATTLYTQIEYSPQDLLVFGSEVTGLPASLFTKWPERFVTIPMLPNKRCLNLATSVGIALYEAWRQRNFS